MPPLSLNGVAIDDTFAEAFGMRATAVVITADTAGWARQAAVTMTGFATSVIACGCEAAVDAELDPADTPDGRPGVRVLIFSVSTKMLETQLQARVGQCVLTSPGSACFAGLTGEEALKIGDALRYFGDGWQIAKQIGGRRFWRIPVMDGEFVCEGTTGLTKAAVGGGNLLLMGRDRPSTLRAAEAAVAAIAAVPDVIMPFPGGIVRSGSKVGSKYKALPASTNHSYCPTLRGRVASELTPEIGSVLEIVIDGLTAESVREAMRAGLHAACALGPDDGALRIGAGNYGGKLGQFHYRLGELLS
ncbi:formylmethanofuran--tetrahydromethanopterin N-formyltransferase [Faunimonas sp. B44]|uniref:formylmethanofuran--tetrahydromethanopterin N-formyltransferase n=1 Tax=Faunimonas sp. B44 TaxID=3461493 RepID=UPI004043E75E